MRSLKLLLLLLCLLPFQSLLAQTKDPAYRLLLEGLYSKTVPLMPVSQAAQLQRAGKKVVFLDTREKEEYLVSHIRDAVWVGYKDFDLKRLSGVSPQTPIVVYCSVGYRSEKIGEQLLKAGFTNVHNLYGSIFEWVNQGYPVYDAKGRPTTRVHAYSRTWGIWLSRGTKVY
ncbi:MAG: rhodanese-like domain-containing protein [Adhaeribacter sp.]